MGTAIRVLLAVWFFMIFGFCVYGFLVTYPMPGELFCRPANYSGMILRLIRLCRGVAVAAARSGAHLLHRR